LLDLDVSSSDRAKDVPFYWPLTRLTFSASGNKIISFYRRFRMIVIHNIIFFRKILHRIESIQFLIVISPIDTYAVADYCFIAQKQVWHGY
jgi:hypothetical protein